MATPTPERSDGPRGAVNVAALRSARPRPELSSTTLITRMAATLSPVLQFWTLALWRVARTVTAPTTAIIKAAASVLAAPAGRPKRRRDFPEGPGRGGPHPRGVTKNTGPPNE